MGVNDEKIYNLSIYCSLELRILAYACFPEALGGGRAARGYHGGFPGGYQWKPRQFPILAGRIIPASSPYPDSGFQLAKARKPQT
jgi:hypothetical protein